MPLRTLQKQWTRESEMFSLGTFQCLGEGAGDGQGLELVCQLKLVQLCSISQEKFLRLD